MTDFAGVVPACELVRCLLKVFDAAMRKKTLVTCSAESSEIQNLARHNEALRSATRSWLLA